MRAAVDWVNHAGAIAARVIGVAGHVVLGIGDRLNQSGRIIGNGGRVVQRIENLGQLAFVIVGELRDTRRLRHRSNTPASFQSTIQILEIPLPVQA